MERFIEVSVEVDGEAAEAVAEALRPFAYQDSVVLEQLGDEDGLDPEALDPVVTVKIYLPEKEDTPEKRRRMEEILYHMSRLYPIPAPRFKVLAETDWANAWKAHYEPFRIGERIWIEPSWLEQGERPRHKEGDVVLVLDPGMAFGTGLHPTTQKCLRMLERIVEGGDSILDVGTGSGILAIAAVKLGAARAVGVDTDGVAVRTAAANAALNDAAAQTMFWQGRLDSVAERDWDVVVVNILAPVIIELLTQNNLLGYVGSAGRLVLSGIIDEQAPAVEEAVRQVGGSVSDRLTLRDWVTLLVQPAAGDSS